MDSSQKHVLISVIVPVYNVEKYLRCCLDSILAQTYTNWECILVDDGSTDASGKICDEYAANDNRINVIHKENGGVSSARNLGIEKAKGEWIFFMDSDDEIKKEAINTMFGWSKMSDMVVGVYQIQDHLSNQNECRRKKKRYIDRNVSPIRLLKYMMKTKFNISATVFPRLYKASIIRENNIYFSSDIYYAEDQLFLAEYICCPKVRTIHINNIKPLYMYNLWHGTAMDKFDKQFNEKIFTDFMGFYKIYKTYKNRFNDEQINNWCLENLYRSGMHILSLINRYGIDAQKYKQIVKEQLEFIKGSNNGIQIVRNYDTWSGLNHIKNKAKNMDRPQKSAYVNQWLHSSKCDFKYLNKRWLLLYTISHIFGAVGVNFIIDKIDFGV